MKDKALQSTADVYSESLALYSPQRGFAGKNLMQNETSDSFLSYEMKHSSSISCGFEQMLLKALK